MSSYVNGTKEPIKNKFEYAGIAYTHSQNIKTYFVARGGTPSYDVEKKEWYINGLITAVMNKVIPTAKKDSQVSFFVVSVKVRADPSVMGS